MCQALFREAEVSLSSEDILFINAPLVCQGIQTAEGDLLSMALDKSADYEIRVIHTLDRKTLTPSLIHSGSTINTHSVLE